MVYRVPIPLYLEMIDGLGSAQRFGLSNQTLDNGFVVFNGAGGRKRLQTILDWFNDSKPPSGVYLKTYTVKAGEFTLEGLQKHVEALRGPDDDGFYHGRCPSCVAEGLHGRHSAKTISMQTKRWKDWLLRRLQEIRSPCLLQGNERFLPRNRSNYSPNPNTVRKYPEC